MLTLEVEALGCFLSTRFSDYYTKTDTEHLCRLPAGSTFSNVSGRFCSQPAQENGAPEQLNCLVVWKRGKKLGREDKYGWVTSATASAHVLGRREHLFGKVYLRYQSVDCPPPPFSKKNMESIGKAVWWRELRKRSRARGGVKKKKRQREEEGGEWSLLIPPHLAPISMLGATKIMFFTLQAFLCYKLPTSHCASLTETLSVGQFFFLEAVCSAANPPPLPPPSSSCAFAVFKTRSQIRIVARFLTAIHTSCSHTLWVSLWQIFLYFCKQMILISSSLHWSLKTRTDSGLTINWTELVLPATRKCWSIKLPFFFIIRVPPCWSQTSSAKPDFHWSACVASPLRCVDIK